MTGETNHLRIGVPDITLYGHSRLGLREEFKNFYASVSVTCNPVSSSRLQKPPAVFRAAKVAVGTLIRTLRGAREVGPEPGPRLARCHMIAAGGTHATVCPLRVRVTAPEQYSLRP